MNSFSFISQEFITQKLFFYLIPATFILKCLPWMNDFVCHFWYFKSYVNKFKCKQLIISNKVLAASSSESSYRLKSSKYSQQYSHFKISGAKIKKWKIHKKIITVALWGYLSLQILHFLFFLPTSEDINICECWHTVLSGFKDEYSFINDLLFKVLLGMMSIWLI